ncbi:MAG TPA: hypothetical protein VE685_12095 [Thermoanaerobaculia bacterium]|nr:hypothetical protein [Thermoanaerobaculia bacterium]
MSKTMIRLTTILLAVAVMFTLAGVAEAGNLAPRKAPGFDTMIGVGEQGSLLGQAWAWLTSLWTWETHETVAKTGSGAGDSGSTTNTTTTCTKPEGCDAGWGLDPNG